MLSHLGGFPGLDRLDEIKRKAAAPSPVFKGRFQAVFAQGKVPDLDAISAVVKPGGTDFGKDAIDFLLRTTIERLEHVQRNLTLFAKLYPWAQVFVNLIAGAVQMFDQQVGRAMQYWNDALTLAREKSMTLYMAQAHYWIGAHLRVQDPLRRMHLLEARALFMHQNAQFHVKLVNDFLTQLSYFDLGPQLRATLGAFTAQTDHLKRLHAAKAAPSDIHQLPVGVSSGPQRTGRRDKPKRNKSAYFGREFKEEFKVHIQA